MDTEQRSAVVLVAEDPFVGRFLRAVLQRHGYQVVIAEPARAVAMLWAGELTPKLVITNTPQVFLGMAEPVPLLYLAAMPDAQLAARFPLCRTLHKPFRNEDLLEAVGTLTASS